MSFGFLSFNRSFLDDPLWVSLTPDEQHVFNIIAKLACYRPQKFNDHGLIIDLEPGQLCISQVDLAKKCHRSITKTKIERAIEKLKLCGFLRQEVRRKKSILTVSKSVTYEGSNKLIEAGNEAILRQSRGNLEAETKEVKKEKKEKKEHKASQAPLIEKIAFRPLVKLFQSEFDSLLAKHGKPKMDVMLDYLDSYKGSKGKEYASDYHVMKSGGWLEAKFSTNSQPPGQTDRRTKDINGNPVSSPADGRF